MRAVPSLPTSPRPEAIRRAVRRAGLAGATFVVLSPSPTASAEKLARDGITVDLPCTPTTTASTSQTLGPVLRSSCAVGMQTFQVLTAATDATDPRAAHRAVTDQLKHDGLLSGQGMLPWPRDAFVGTAETLVGSKVVEVRTALRGGLVVALVVWGPSTGDLDATAAQVFFRSLWFDGDKPPASRPAPPDTAVTWREVPLPWAESGAEALFVTGGDELFAFVPVADAPFGVYDVWASADGRGGWKLRAKQVTAYDIVAQGGTLWTRDDDGVSFSTNGGRKFVHDGTAPPEARLAGEVVAWRGGIAIRHGRQIWGKAHDEAWRKLPDLAADGFLAGCHRAEADLHVVRPWGKDGVAGARLYRDDLWMRKPGTGVVSCALVVATDTWRDPAGAMVSFDETRSWVTIGPELGELMDVRAVSGGVIYVSGFDPGRGYGLFRTRDGGATYERLVPPTTGTPGLMLVAGDRVAVMLLDPSGHVVDRLAFLEE